MVTSTRRRVGFALPAPMPPDPALPGAHELLAEPGIELASGFVAARGWEPKVCRPVQALHQPGRSLVVRYRVEASGPAGARRAFWVCGEQRAHAKPPAMAAVAEPVLPDPVAQESSYLVWVFPHDPGLPGLEGAARGPAVREALARHGQRLVAVSVEPLRYRPRKRAAFRYTLLRGDGPPITRYGKVLRPSRATRLARVGELLVSRRGDDRAPRLGLPSQSDAGGRFLFEPLPGRSLRDLLLAGASLPRPERVAALIADLGALGRRRGFDVPDGQRAATARLEHARRALAHLLPEARAEVERLADTIGAELAREPVATQLVHGDLYEAQVLVAPGFSLGLIDVDDLGAGDPVMDAANFCAHLVALAMVSPRAAGVLLVYRRLARAAFLAGLDASPRAFAAREALAMLLLATAPFRVVDPVWPREVRRRVDLASRVLARHA